MTETQAAERIDRLLDAIELIKLGKRRDAVTLLKALIREDSDFEDAWLWMSVAVDSIDQSVICLDNVLRINPNNAYAAGALYRLRASEMAMQRRRARYRLYRDIALILFAGVFGLTLCMIVVQIFMWSSAL
ncbi:MAG: hypothetical protein D6712_01635 [Chloroflexi bacterium]|nr:MAG: hypothetical protein D6712_01635 [Chloroflexota bacterium]